MKLKSENRKKLAVLKQALGKGIPLSALIAGAALAGGCSSERAFGTSVMGDYGPANRENEVQKPVIRGELDPSQSGDKANAQNEKEESTTAGLKSFVDDDSALEQPDVKPNAKNEKTPPPLQGKPLPPPEK